MTIYPHPACMEPDGGDGPCAGYQALQAKVLTKDELNLIRQWFNATEDAAPSYLGKSDYDLMEKIMADLPGFQFKHKFKRK